MSTEYQSLYLQKSGNLARSEQADMESVRHVADSYQAKPSEFRFTFEKPTNVVGHSKAELWMSCDDLDDMDVFVSLRKISKEGKVLEHVNVPWRSLPKGVDTQDDVPMAQTVKVILDRLLLVNFLTNASFLRSTLAPLAFSELPIVPRTPTRVHP